MLWHVAQRYRALARLDTRRGTAFAGDSLALIDVERSRGDTWDGPATQYTNSAAWRR